jgi:hypothetical protein
VTPSKREKSSGRDFAARHGGANLFDGLGAEKREREGVAGVVVSQDAETAEEARGISAGRHLVTGIDGERISAPVRGEAAEKRSRRSDDVGLAIRDANKALAVGQLNVNIEVAETSDSGCDGSLQEGMVALAGALDHGDSGVPQRDDRRSVRRAKKCRVAVGFLFADGLAGIFGCSDFPCFAGVENNGSGLEFVRDEEVFGVGEVDKTGERNELRRAEDFDLAAQLVEFRLRVRSAIVGIADPISVGELGQQQIDGAGFPLDVAEGHVEPMKRAIIDVEDGFPLSAENQLGI